jgi:hypothetical protein
MPTKKKVVRKPIEKLSEREQIEVIEDSSSSDEDFDEIPPPPPVPTGVVEVAPAKVKKPPSEKQLAYYKKMRERAAEKRKAKSTEAKAAIDNAINEMDISTHPVKAKPIVEEDPDDKPVTKKEMKKYLASQKEEAPAPAPAPVVKPKRKYTKRAKKEPTQSPAPVKNPIVSQSSMMFV